MAVVKMINNKSQSIQGLLCVIAYACKDAKTNHEGQRLITGINCVPSLAFDEFMTTKRLYNQDGGRMFYHMVQSFSPEENITPEVAHEIACKLADAIPGFEIVVATHCDADHVHSHFVINSVNYETGMKYHSDQQSIHALWDASDQLCLQYGLSVIKRKQNDEHRMNDREYRAYMRGNSWKMALEIAIDDCMTLAYNREHFMQLMEWRGYEVTWSDTRKNITYTTPQGYKCRDRKLNGRKYLKEEMEYEFELRAAICRRYAGATEKESRPGNSSATDRRRHGTQLAGADRSDENSDRNRSTDFGTAGATGNDRGIDFLDGQTDRGAGGVPGGCHPSDAGLSEAGFDRSEGCAEADAGRNEGDRNALWRSEREIFESNLRRAAEHAQVDAPVFTHQPHSKCAASHIVIDAAYLTANLLGMFENDDEKIEDCTTRYYGPTLRM